MAKKVQEVGMCASQPHLQHGQAIRKELLLHLAKN